MSRQILLLLSMLLSCLSLHASVETDRIQTLIADGKLRQALTFTDKQLKVDEANVTLRFLKGLILTRLNELDQARELFIGLTREHPELPEPYNNLAVIYASQGDFDKAREALQKAISTHPSYATAHENMGDIYAKMASKAYNQALELDAEQMAARKAQEEKLALETRAALAEKQAMEARKALEEKKMMEASRAMEAEKAMQSLKAEEAQNALQAQKLLEEKQALEARTAMAEKQAMEASQALEQEKALQARKEIEEKQAIESKQLQREQFKSDVASTVEQWAKAWSAKDAKGYISFYGKDFSPPKKISRSAWEAQRKLRLNKPRFIKITISELDITMLGDEHAQAEFRQTYESDTYKDEVNKSLILKKVAGRWLISQEESR